MAVEVLNNVHRRGYQDYSTWASFGTAVLWRDIDAAPACAAELITRHLHKMLCKNPAERSSADVASGIAVATYGPIGAAMLSTSQVTAIYEQFKVRQ